MESIKENRDNTERRAYLRKVRKLGGQAHLDAMQPEARALLLGLKNLNINKRDLLRGGLERRGFTAKKNIPVPENVKKNKMRETSRKWREMQKRAVSA